MPVRFDELRKALSSLEKALKQPKGKLPGHECPGTKWSGRGFDPGPRSAGVPPRPKGRGFPLLDEFTRDASILRFEYTFELTWKVGKKVLETLGIISRSPNSVIRDMGQQLWIEDVEKWLHFLDSRNLSTHTYKEVTAEQVYETAQAFLVECKKLVTHLEQVKPR